jgi:hypothetical protein
MDFSLCSGAAMRLNIVDLKTPAKLYRLNETPTSFGGILFAPQFEATLWGDFIPEAPETLTTSQGEVITRQEALFLCRSSQGLSRGAQLKISGLDWDILSFDQDQDGSVRVRIERVH